jgi:hypothetical protein
LRIELVVVCGVVRLVCDHSRLKQAVRVLLLGAVELDMFGRGRRVRRSTLQANEPLGPSETWGELKPVVFVLQCRRGTFQANEPLGPSEFRNLLPLDRLGLAWAQQLILPQSTTTKT